jgi:hypothetical protein
MPSLFQIVANTPLWVWPLMVFVLWLGWQGLQPRIVPPWRPALLPLISVCSSLSGVAQSVQPDLSAAGWAAGLLAALPLGHALGRGRAVHLRPDDGRLAIAGGWFTLAFGLSIFVVRYVQGVAFGILPSLKLEPLWIGLSGGLGGVVAGIGIGWVASLLLRARRASLAKG